MAKERSIEEVLAEASKMIYAVDLLSVEKEIVKTEQQTWKSVAKLDTTSILWSEERFKEMAEKPKEEIQSIYSERKEILKPVVKYQIKKTKKK